MGNKQYWLTVVVFFVAAMATDFVLHGVLLHGDYLSIPSIMRTPEDSQQYFHFMLLAHVFIAVSFVAIYQRGIETGKPWLGQGVRFGLLVAFLTVVPTYMIYYVVQPMPAMLVVKQIVFDLVRTTALGVLVAWMYRAKA
jgi:hypothetical protein